MSKSLNTFMTTTGINGNEIEFAFDENNNLYIDGKRVVTHEVVRLRWAEFIVLCLTAGAIIAQAIFAGLTYFC